MGLLLDGHDRTATTHANMMVAASDTSALAFVYVYSHPISTQSQQLHQCHLNRRHFEFQSTPCHSNVSPASAHRMLASLTSE
jgi:hypothetical protein